MGLIDKIGDTIALMYMRHINFGISEEYTFNQLSQNKLWHKWLTFGEQPITYGKHNA